MVSEYAVQRLSSNYKAQQLMCDYSVPFSDFVGISESEVGDLSREWLQNISPSSGAYRICIRSVSVCLY